MHLIVAEKNISAHRIASILAGNKRVKEEKDGGVPVYRFDDTAVVGLRGHVVEIDFEEGYSNWRSTERTPRSLIDARTIKVPTVKKIVQLLQKLAKQSTLITIATDFDTEGELIGKEAYELIRQVAADAAQLLDGLVQPVFVDYNGNGKPIRFGGLAQVNRADGWPL